MAREIRLRAERDGATSLEIPETIRDVPVAMENHGQRDSPLHRSPRRTLKAESSVLRERLKQLEVEASSLLSQAETKARKEHDDS